MSAPIDEDGYELAMPFVIVRSAGGPHDDDAFVAGWECAVLDTRLAVFSCLEGGSSFRFVCRSSSWPQVDLIVMKHDFKLVSKVETDDGEWLSVEIGAAS